MKIYKADETTVNFNLAEVDSITFSSVTKSIALSKSNWECFVTSLAKTAVEPAEGVYEENNEGLKIYGAGSETTRALRLKNVGESIITGKTVYLKWKLSGSGAVTSDLYADTVNFNSAGKALSVSSSLISTDTWYYSRITTSDGTAKTITSTGTYDNNGGTPVFSAGVNLTGNAVTFSFGISAESGVYALLGEARVE